jgi:O-antigen/teichoic acid export membrane protein
MKRRLSVEGISGPRLARHREFLGHVATLMSGKAFAGLVAIVTMPVVARLFSPEHFGVAALFVSIVNMIASFATLSYASAVVLPDDDSEALLLTALAYRLLALASVLLFTVIVVLELSGMSWQTLELLGRWKWLLPAALLLVVAIRIQEYWLTREKAFRIVSVSLIAGNASTGISRIGLGLLGGSSVFGLIGGHMLGMCARILVQWSRCAGTLRSALRRIPASTLCHVGRRYADFPLYNMPAAVVHTLGQNLPVVLLGVMFSPAVAGLFAMARQLLDAPTRMVSESVRRVFLQKAASIHRQGRSLKKAYFLSTGALALAGLPAVLILSTFGQPIATWFLGDRWFEAGRYMEIIAPWLFMLWVMAPCKATYIVLRRQRQLLWIEMILTTLRVGVFGVAHIIEAGPQWTLQIFVTVTVVVNVATILVAILLILREPGGPVPPRIDSC